MTGVTDISPISTTQLAYSRDFEAKITPCASHFCHSALDVTPCQYGRGVCVLRGQVSSSSTILSRDARRFAHPSTFSLKLIGRKETNRRAGVENRNALCRSWHREHVADEKRVGSGEVIYMYIKGVLDHWNNCHQTPAYLNATFDVEQIHSSSLS